jgi:hypothetical protein
MGGEGLELYLVTLNGDLPSMANADEPPKHTALHVQHLRITRILIESQKHFSLPENRPDMGVSAKDTLRILSATDAFHATQSRPLSLSEQNLSRSSQT